MLAPFVIAAFMHIVGALSIQGVAVNTGSGDSASVATVDFLLSVMAVFAPAVILVKALVATALTWAILVLLSAQARFRILFSINMYGAVVLALPGIAMALVVRFRQPVGTQGLEDLIVPMGLDAIIDFGTSPTTLAVMQQITVFHILWAVLLAWLLSRAAKVSVARSTVTSVALWGLGIGYAVVRSLVFARFT